MLVTLQYVESFKDLVCDVVPSSDESFACASQRQPTQRSRRMEYHLLFRLVLASDGGAIVPVARRCEC